MAWKFDPETGTMKDVSPAVPAPAPVKVDIPRTETGEEMVSFPVKTGLRVIQICDDETNNVMGYIAGYGLDIKFNTEELNSVERIEQFIRGVDKLVRDIILNNAIGKANDNEQSERQGK